MEAGPGTHQMYPDGLTLCGQPGEGGGETWKEGPSDWQARGVWGVNSYSEGEKLSACARILPKGNPGGQGQGQGQEAWPRASCPESGWLLEGLCGKKPTGPAGLEQVLAPQMANGGRRGPCHLT